MNQTLNYIRKASVFLSCCLLFSLQLTAQNFSANSCVTKCHQDQVNKNFIHGPTAVDCTSCHESNGQEHPLENVAGFALVAEGKDLCFGCHTEDTEDFSMRYKHEPLKNGE